MTASADTTMVNTTTNIEQFQDYDILSTFCLIGFVELISVQPVLTEFTNTVR